MANEKNLISLANRSPEERKAIARKGKVASDRAKKRKKETQAVIRELLAAPVEIPAKTRNALKKLGFEGDAPTVELLAIVAIANQAMAGDLASAKFLYDYAQIPDMRTVLDQARLQLAKESQEQAREGGADKVTVILDV